jgi:DNA repair protein SbcD/Mre11
VRFVHAADLHIDSPLRGLERYPGAPVDRVRGATRRAFENLVAHCIETEAHVLMLAGDLFDRDWRDYGTGLFFVSQLNRLREVGTHVLVLRGNHDAKNAVTRNLRYPEHVFEFPSDKPHVRRIADSRFTSELAVHGQSFADAKTPDDLALTYADAIRGCVNIGMLHTSLDGRPGHDSYAPTRSSILIDKGYHYWALGHVHAREIVHETPWIVYPGNLQGRHARETGPKGCTAFELEDDRVTSVRAVELDVLRFNHLVLALAERSNFDDALEEIARAIDELRQNEPDRILALRITLDVSHHTGELLTLREESLQGEVRGLALRHHDVWVEKILVRVRRDLGAEASANALPILAHLRAEESGVQAHALALESLSELPEAVREGVEPESVVADARRMLLAELAGEEA